MIENSLKILCYSLLCRKLNRCPDSLASDKSRIKAVHQKTHVVACHENASVTNVVPERYYRFAAALSLIPALKLFAK